VIRYHVRLLDDIKVQAAHLPPELKRKFKMAVVLLGSEPRAGKPLTQELAGLWSYPVDRFRIIYLVELARLEVQVVRFGPRETIYNLLAQHPFVRDRSRRKGTRRRVSGTASLLR
jgi:mRNA-degrading endonuclease RelE of RelBE toxin-antitoxin system